jgi:hypothetical protein
VLIWKVSLDTLILQLRDELAMSLICQPRLVTVAVALMIRTIHTVNEAQVARRLVGERL